ncbi:unnamed protein product [Knipowitschia caucasica]
MAHRGHVHLESVSCSCGHGYCVFCIKSYMDQQKLRESYPQDEVEWLIEVGDVQDMREKLQNSNFNFNLEKQGPQRSRPGSRRVSGQVYRNSQGVGEADIELLQPDFNSKDEFIPYAQEITLDHDSAHEDLALSEWNKRVMNIGRSQGYLDCPDRFDFFWQVLSINSLEQQSYFELEWSGDWIYVAVAYPSIQRHGNTKECGFGGNEKSWALFCRQSGYSFWHDGKSVPVTGPVEFRIGVYLDYKVGVLTFYSVQDQKMTALYRVQSRFTQPLHVGLWMAVDASAVVSQL